MILAITGATGFVGKTLVARALAAGDEVRALTRRPQPPRAGLSWVEGDLGDEAALALLLRGADAVIHVAGVVNAPDRAGFIAGNVDGTRSIVEAAEEAGVTRFVHVSSLAAREPRLSQYGWSKHEAEAIVERSGLAWTIVRPPGVYGPGDLDQLDLFRVARFGLALLPPAGRLSAIYVDDLADLLLALAAQPGDRRLYEPEGPGGAISHADYGRAIGTAVGRRVVALSLPAPLLRLAARGDRLLRGTGARLTPDRVAYFLHTDWAADPARRPPPALWTPATPLAQGLAETARWYRANGLL